MPPDTLDTLRQVNEYLRSALLNLRPERKHCSAIQPRDFHEILGQLMRAAETLRQPPVNGATAAALQDEALEYRRNLEKLKQFLPDLQISLLAERSRLETARSHAAAASAWAQARKGQ